MKTSEKVAYLKGLADGLGLERETKEGKLIAGIIDVLEDIALDLEEIEDNALDLGEEIDALSEDLAQVEEIIYDEDDDDDDDDDEYCDCGCSCGEGDCPVFYEVTCPGCDNTITVDKDVLDLGVIDCPNCGETLEFDFDEEESAEPEQD